MKSADPPPTQYRSLDDYAISSELKYPTFKDMLEIYPKIAETYSEQTGGKCCKERRANVINGTRAFLRFVRLPETIEYRSVNSRMVDEFLKVADKMGLSRFTSNSYLYSVKSLGAKWTHIPYSQHGFKVESLVLPPIQNPVYRYQTQSDDTKQRVKDAYKRVETEDPCVWFFMTMMLNFGMRNSDVKLLTWDNFVETAQGVFLRYTPHKTRLTSGRNINWPIPNDMWNKILRYMKKHPFAPFDPPIRGLGSTKNNAGAVEARLRELMRSIGFSGSKSAYELRKLCADTVYSKYGQEMASAITGDNIDTVTKYYADPSVISKEVDVSKMM